jgi:hypothetical protein
MFLLLSYQGDYDIAAPWHLEQIRTDERRHGIIIPDLTGCSVLKHTQTHTLQAKTRGRRARQAASMSNASRHFLSTVIFASPQLVRSIDERFSVFVAYWAGLSSLLLGLHMACFLDRSLAYPAVLFAANRVV